MDYHQQREMFVGLLLPMILSTIDVSRSQPLQSFPDPGALLPPGGLPPPDSRRPPPVMTRTPGVPPEHPAGVAQEPTGCVVGCECTARVLRCEEPDTLTAIPELPHAASVQEM